MRLILMTLLLGLSLSAAAAGSTGGPQAEQQITAERQITEAIDQARALALKKNRRGACAVLRRALEDVPASNKTARAKLTEALNHIARIFLTDKGQRAFEAGQSLMYENPDLAANHLRDALKSEDGNIAVLGGIAKLQLAKMDCDAAAATVTEARGLDPVAPEAAVLELRAHVCRHDFAALREAAKRLPVLDKPSEQVVQFLLAQDDLQQNSAKKAFDRLIRLSEELPQFPETYFYLARAGADLGKDDQEWLEKYISLCKVVTGHERKRYSLEPRLCANLKDAEDEVARKTVDM